MRPHDARYVILCNNKDICRKHRAASPMFTHLSELKRLAMAFVSTQATRTAVFVIALSGAGLWGLRAMDARADPPAMDDASPCAEGRALFAAKLAYLEARISPEPSREEAWRSFADAMRGSVGAVDRACVEYPPRPLSVDAGERLKHMERHAAAMQAIFGAMANAYMAIAPST
jgi:hypothetical protein